MPSKKAASDASKVGTTSATVAGKKGSRPRSSSLHVEAQPKSKSLKPNKPKAGKKGSRPRLSSLHVEAQPKSKSLKPNKPNNGDSRRVVSLVPASLHPLVMSSFLKLCQERADVIRDLRHLEAQQGGDASPPQQVKRRLGRVYLADVTSSSAVSPDVTSETDLRRLQGATTLRSTGGASSCSCSEEEEVYEGASPYLLPCPPLCSYSLLWLQSAVCVPVSASVSRTHM
jgi:hypothetical protein